MLVHLDLAISERRSGEAPVSSVEKTVQSVVERKHRFKRIPDDVVVDVVGRKGKPRDGFVVGDELVPVPELEHALGQRKILARVADVRQFPVAERDASIVATDLLADPVLSFAKTHAGG